MHEPTFIKTVLLSTIGCVWVMIGCQVAMPPKTGGALPTEGLKEGVYKGSYGNGPNSAVVKVTIKENRIEEVHIVRHFSSWKGFKVNEIIPMRIVAEQSTSVDAISGATNSSIVIMNAAQEAIEKAYE
jgi:uncharacterized protein with FMN-binding domain